MAANSGISYMPIQNGDSVYILQTSSKDLYWVGGSGMWTDTNHWSFVSGGTPGACLPGPNDNVFFDGNSFTNPGDSVVLNIYAFCKDMNWTGSTNNPHLKGRFDLSLYGSLTLIAGMNLDHTGTIYFESFDTGKTVTTGNNEFQNNAFVFLEIKRKNGHKRKIKIKTYKKA